MKRIKRAAKNRDKMVERALVNKDKDWVELDKGVVAWKDRIYVPRDQKLRADLIRLHHDTSLAGHPGRFKTQELITRNYWWPRLQADIRSYVDGCPTCQMTKPHRKAPPAPLSPNAVPTRPWQIVTVDLIGPLPMAHGYDMILVFVDRFTKAAKFQACNSEINSLGFAKHYRDRVFRDHGLSERLIHDRGTQFASQFSRDLCKLLGNKQNISTAYHPQTDGQTERVNQDLEQYLRIFTNFRQDDWDEWLAIAEFSYNDKIHTATGHSPFFLNSGQHPWKGIEPRGTVRTAGAAEFAKNMQKIRTEAESSLKAAAETMKRFYDQNRSESVDYKVGDLVYLEGTNIETVRPAQKLSNKRYGPFKILEKIGSSSYRLKLPPSWSRKHPVFNEVLLSPFTAPKFPSQKKTAPPPPELVDDHEEYEVEEVLDSRLRDGKLEYFVHWKGYPHEDDSWEPVSHLKENAGAIIKDFHRKHPSAPRPRPQNVRFTYKTIENFTTTPRLPGHLYNWENGKVDSKLTRPIVWTQSLRGG
jgi:hypothetical protein